MKINTGGPAQPVLLSCHPNSAGEGAQTGSYEYWHTGMTLRDWFAGQALAGICASNAPCNADGKSIPGLLSEAAYVIADAMIKARETPND